MFEQLTHIAQWKDLIAEVATFKTVGTDRIPCLQLVSHHASEVRAICQASHVSIISAGLMTLIFGMALKDAKCSIG